MTQHQPPRRPNTKYRRARSLITPVDKSIGQTLRHHRLVAGLTQQQMGEACGVSSQQIQKYESGANRIAASRLVEFARVLAVPAAALLAPINAADPHHIAAPLTARLMSAALTLDPAPLANLVALAEQIQTPKPGGPSNRMAS